MDVNISSKIEKIFSMIEKVKKNIEKIQSKIINLNKVIAKFKQNKLLHEKHSYLVFQVKLLTNERTYYQSIKDTILNKMFTDIYHIYEKILMLISSVETLDIEHEEEKNNIINNIQVFKKDEPISCSSAISLSSATVGNLELVNDFVNIFEDYIQKIDKQNIANNMHCNNLTTNLKTRNEHIKLEYIRFRDQLNELVSYFVKCSGFVTSQLDKQELINFLIE